MDLVTVVQLIAAFILVATLHEFGHRPEKIKFKLIFPVAAMRAKSRLGGLMVNVALFLTIYFLQPSIVFFQYVGLIAWAHFILYAIIGSIVPEPKISSVNIATYVFDDVPNKLGVWFISAAIISFVLLKNYYLPVLLSLL